MQFTRPVLIALAATAIASAQTNKTKTVSEDVLLVQSAPAVPAMKVTGGTANVMYFVRDSKPVKGAPYSAESQTETVQTLADGNRIVRSSSSKTYRDSEGRTRTDSSVNALGPWVADGQSLSISTIFDPTTGESISLNHQQKTAVKAGQRLSVVSADAPSAGATTISDTVAGVTSIRTGEAKQDVRIAGEVGPIVVAPLSSGSIEGAPPLPALPGMGAGISFTTSLSTVTRDSQENQKESLGTKTIEGVVCEGTRITETIAAKAIGNEKPIEIVTERWYSPELQTEVLRTHNDPRFGETSFKLTNIVRAEQPKSLFEIPADYQVEDGARAPMRIHMQQPKK